MYICYCILLCKIIIKFVLLIYCVNMLWKDHPIKPKIFYKIHNIGYYKCLVPNIMYTTIRLQGTALAILIESNLLFFICYCTLPCIYIHINDQWNTCFLANLKKENVKNDDFFFFLTIG